MAKGKQATKGQKQILEENNETIKFYMIMSFAASGLHFLVNYILFWEKYSFLSMLATVFSILVYASALSVMKFMAKPVYSDSGSLIDGGIDLNMEGGFAEHLKDLIILTTICECLSLISNYFWILWSLAPGRAAYLLFVNVISPWIFQSPPEVEVDEKKQKKLERKRMKRI
ncbi:DUF788 membrane protein-like protein [Dinothrombium tinctorium]|uniref:Transmembrane protein 208 n=1 Tax=Dinothrombium tinctorium TaxID=1965070 RepID=A0A3S3SH86_9ACAR|nr:DUF788 membrane protein-like protein [Dinothrombium tinctorium]RWS13840.1 DUF788 membrane protein-like protein [Dinothrombium tinctorium]RWS15240.1 DUF788 membrane protein-like protein [Dinothrombium tinctorium]